MAWKLLSSSTVTTPEHPLPVTRTRLMPALFKYCSSGRSVCKRLKFPKAGLFLKDATESQPANFQQLQFADRAEPVSHCSYSAFHLKTGNSLKTAGRSDYLFCREMLEVRTNYHVRNMHYHAVMWTTEEISGAKLEQSTLTQVSFLLQPAWF